jgi:peptidoglycan/LPS O-acetylase OafA/YrhL
MGRLVAARFMKTDEQKAPREIVMQGHLPWLDLLRFVAALVVVFVHARGEAFVIYSELAPGQQGIIPALFYAATRVGNEAVLLFFVLSGFLVGGKTFQRILNNDFRSTDYAIDRISRIFVPLLPCLLLTTLVGFFLGTPFRAHHLLGNLVFLQGISVPSFGGNDPLWSLAYEVWFYVLAWTVGILRIGKQFNVLPIAISVLLFVIFTKLQVVYLFCWLLGAIGYLCPPRRFSPWYVFMACLTTAYAILGIQLQSESDFGPLQSFKWLALSLPVSRLLVAAGATVLIQQVLLLPPMGGFSKWADKTGTRLAAFSYTLYLCHFPVLKLLSSLGMGSSRYLSPYSLGCFAVMILASVFSSWLLYRAFEQHTPEFRHWLKGIILSRQKAYL